jgi:hypothetical protein
MIQRASRLGTTGQRYEAAVVALIRGSVPTEGPPESRSGVSAMLPPPARSFADRAMSASAVSLPLITAQRRLRVRNSEPVGVVTIVVVVAIMVVVMPITIAVVFAPIAMVAIPLVMIMLPIEGSDGSRQATP